MWLPLQLKCDSPFQMINWWPEKWICFQLVTHQRNNNSVWGRVAGWWMGVDSWITVEQWSEWKRGRERERRERERWSGTVWVRKCKINKQKKKRFYMFWNKLTLWHEIIWPKQHTHIWILDTSYQDCAANRLQSPPGNNSQEKCILCQKCISGAAHWCCERSLSLSHSSDSPHRCWMKRWVGATLYLTLQCRSSQNAAKKLDDNNISHRGLWLLLYVVLNKHPLKKYSKK